MGKQLALACVLGFCAMACTSSSSGDDVELVKGFNPPPVADGYTRYVLPAIKGLRPGEDKMFCQWVALPATEDLDIVAIQGYQSVTGHHAILYSSAETETVGTTRECTTEDMVSVEFLGGIGGEAGGNDVVLPEGYVFRSGKQRMLMANAHYLNATDSVQDVQSVLDVKTAAPSSNHTPVGMAVINYNDFQIPANAPSYSVDAYCTWAQDASLLLWSNHMHANGVSMLSEVKHTNGTVETLATDTQWRAEEAFNPTFTHYDAGTPMKIKAGDQGHIKCTWQNNTDSPVLFPDEMCDAFGFYTESSAQMICDAAPATGM
jgi:hypothetical protein